MNQYDEEYVATHHSRYTPHMHRLPLHSRLACTHPFPPSLTIPPLTHHHMSHPQNPHHTDTSARLVHPRVPPNAARALGCASLRQRHTIDTALTHPLTCPHSDVILRSLAATPLPAVLADVVQVADACGAATVDIVVDMRSHPTQRLLHPAMAALQGPALCFRLHGMLLHAWRVLGATCCMVGVGWWQWHVITHIVYTQKIGVVMVMVVMVMVIMTPTKNRMK